MKTGNSTISSFVWKFMERMSSQIVNLIVQVVLARIIDPKDFGMLAIMIVFVNVATIFVQKGLSSSIIRKKNADEKDYNTAFITSFIIAVLIYIIIFIAAPFIADVYHLYELKNGLRVISISLLFGALYCIQNAIMVRELKFRAIFVRGLISSVFSGIVGIGLALKGMGVWALIIQTLVNQIMLCITAWNKIDWRPKMQFSRGRLNEILSFGGRILVSEILSYSVESIRTLFIGVKYSSEQLSYYDRGQTYPATLMRGIYDTIGGVLLPVFSRKQDNVEQLSSYFSKTLSVIMFIVTPFFIGFAAVADTLIRILLTDKWEPAIPFVIIFCMAQLAQPVQGICRQLIYAKGDSKVVLKIEIIKDVISLLLLFLFLPFGPIAIAISFLISMYLAAFIMLIAAVKSINITLKKIIICILKPWLYSLIMYLAVWEMNKLQLLLIIKLLCQVLSGVIIYLGLALLLRDSNLYMCIKWIKIYFQKLIKINTGGK